MAAKESVQKKERQIMNQKDDCEGKEQTEPLADLALNTEHAQETKAGGRFAYSPEFRGGVSVASGDVN
jgi:hypothetical protein